MPHGISSPHSSPRSSNFHYLLWNSSTSLPVSTDTRLSYNISTLSYKLSSPYKWAPYPWTVYCLFWHFFLSPMEVQASLPGQLSTIFSSTKSYKNFSCITDCPTTLMQDFYYRNVLLARNSTDILSAPAGEDHQHKRVPDKLSENIWADYCLFWRFFLSPMEVPATLPSPLSTIFSSTITPTFSPADQTAIRLWCICYQANSRQPIYLIKQTISFTSY